MNMFNLLTEPLIAVRRASGPLDNVSLPQVLALLASDETIDFPNLRPHQQPAWHAFLVQLAYLALEDDESPPSADDVLWAERLRALTPHHPGGEPWHLVVDDWQRPAFLQSPCLPGAEGEYRRSVASAQELDLLITSKNHDEKVGKIGPLTADAALFALVSLQGFTGFLGPGNFNTMRMNGGFGSRAQFRLVFARGWSAEFRRDLSALRVSADALWEQASVHGIGTRPRHRLLWLAPWGAEALSLDEVHPLCLEVSRRVRLKREGSALQAFTAASKSTRVAAKDRKGVVLDPWLPLAKEGTESRALTATPETFGYRRLSPILFEADDYQLPLLARPAPGETGAATLVAQVIVGGQGKSEGCHRREIAVPARIMRRYADERGRLAVRSRHFIELAGAMQGKVLRAALLQFADGSKEPDWKNKDFANFVEPWVADFDRHVDAVFYDRLFESVEAGLDDAAAQARWSGVLHDLALGVFKTATETLPTRDRSRLFAEVRARGLFAGGLRKHFGALLAARSPALPPEAETFQEVPHADTPV